MGTDRQEVEQAIGLAGMTRSRVALWVIDLRAFGEAPDRIMEAALASCLHNAIEEKGRLAPAKEPAGSLLFKEEVSTLRAHVGRDALRPGPTVGSQSAKGIGEQRAARPNRVSPHALAGSASSRVAALLPIAAAPWRVRLTARPEAVASKLANDISEILVLRFARLARLAELVAPTIPRPKRNAAAKARPDTGVIDRACIDLHRGASRCCNVILDGANGRS